MVLAAAGCGGRDPAPPRPAYALAPAAGGLDVVGSGGREIGFGRDRAGVLASVEAVTGIRPRPVDCAGGREALSTGALTLVFEARRFVGWRDADGASAGAGCGRV